MLLTLAYYRISLSPPSDLYRVQLCDRNRLQVLNHAMESSGFGLVTIPCHSILSSGKAEHKLENTL